ncbi:MAG: hypothetical protein SNJ66_11190 [Chloroherpetonaceae bacterium]
MAKGKKTGGRQKGTPNRITADLRERITRLLDATDIEAAFEELDAVNKVKVFTCLAEFVIPKFGRLDMEVETRLAKIEQTLNQLGGENE